MHKNAPATLSLLLLNIAAVGCASDSFPLPEGDDEGSDTAVIPNGVPLDDAEWVAERFVSLHADRSPTWARATLEPPFVYFDATGSPVLYEFPVHAVDGAPAGSVKVGAVEGAGVVRSFFTSGPATAESLLDQLGDKLGESVDEADVELLADGPLFVGVRFFGAAVTDDTVLQDGAGGSIFAPSLVGVDAATLGDWPPPPVVSRESIEEDRQVLDAYLSWSDAKLRDAMASADWVSVTEPDFPSVDVGSGAAEFKNWYQESRPWTTGTCDTGCAPLAMGMLLEYWDATYGDLIGDSSRNEWSSHTHTTVQTMLDDLRNEMGTWCSGGAGSTYTWNIDNGGDAYVDDQGYSWTFNNDLTSLWSNTKTEINAGRPLVLSFAHWRGNHSAVLYEYTDNSGSSNDWVCIKTGWSISPYWECFRPSDYSWSRITKVRP